MIGQRRAVSLFLDEVVDDAISLFTTPMANSDPDAEPTSVVEDLQTWMQQDRGTGGRPEDPSAIRYTALALLVAFYLLVRQGQKVSLAGALRVLLLELTPSQRERLGMQGDLTGTRADEIALAGDAQASTQEQKAGRTAHTREYARLAKFAATMFSPIDPSLFHKTDTLTKEERGQAREAVKAAKARGEKRPTTSRRIRAKMTNALRKAIISDPHHPDRRIDDATAERNQQRLLDTMNKVVAVAAAKAPRGEWAGDLATDETVVITLPRRAGHGTKDHLLVSADPDAYYWTGKNDETSSAQGIEGDDVGFGYGITYLIRVGRPYERRIPEVALGIHIGPPTGGRTDPVRAAHERAQRHGLLADKRQRRLIADMGFTKLDDWLPFLHENGYRPVQDYPTNWDVDIVVPDSDASGRPAVVGPRLIAGQIRCPGATGLSSRHLITPHKETTGPETPEDILKRHQQANLLDALAMPVKDGPRPVKAGRGRLRAGQARDTWAVTVQCPAALGMANCPLVERHDGLRNPEVPDVPNPPEVGDPSLLPRACRQDHVTYQLPLTHAKRLQPFTWGSHQWADAYSPIRSANERYHSQLKHRNSGGVTDAWLEMRGIARAGLLFAIATAVTTDHLIGDFRTKHIQPDGKATFGPREALRRRRQELIRHQQ